MNQQLNLLAEPRARHDDPGTSVAAAAKVKPGNRGRIERIAEIVDEACARGMTADEIWLRFTADDPYWEKRRSTIHGAVSRAVEAGLIVPLGQKDCRLSTLGSIQRIHIHPRWLP